MSQWDDLPEIEAALRSATLPNEPVRICSGVLVVDHIQFASTHLKICKTNLGNDRFLPYLARLKNYTKNITNGSNSD